LNENQGRKSFKGIGFEKSESIDIKNHKMYSSHQKALDLNFVMKPSLIEAVMHNNDGSIVVP